MDTSSDNNNSLRIQHITKKSSDELLSKFAAVGSDKEDKKELQLAKRLKISNITKAKTRGLFSSHNRMYIDQISSLNSPNDASIVEMKSLLPPVVPVAASRRSAKLGRRLGIGKAKVRAREIKNRSIMGAIENTWRRTIESTSKVFMEKHNRHKRLTNDLY